jgi:hypothetical protein
MAQSLAVGVVEAHHTYSIFDGSKRVTVGGTLAKHEWTNPHTFLWVYVPSTEAPGEYDLYGFENGSPNAVMKVGWSKDLLQAGDKIVVEYSPLRDGRKGGHLLSARLPDGRTLRGVGFAGDPSVEQAK